MMTTARDEPSGERVLAHNAASSVLLEHRAPHVLPHQMLPSDEQEPVQRQQQFLAANDESHQSSPESQPVQSQPVQSQPVQIQTLDDVHATSAQQHQQSTSHLSQQPPQPSKPHQTQPKTLMQNEQQPLPHTPADKVAPKQTIQVFADPEPTQPKSLHPCPRPVIEHDDKENIPPNIWMHYALQQQTDDKNKQLKPKKLAIPLSEAGVHKKRDLSRSPLRDITSAVVGNRRSNLLTHPRSPHKKRNTLRYLR
ncbi:unnamed protein product [Agarophyton chilense]